MKLRLHEIKPLSFLRVREFAFLAFCLKSITSEHASNSNDPPNRRRLIYIPPPPITPFRGGIKSIPRNQSQNAEDHANSGKESQSSTAWTPEEYPDPWTNPLACGGAATAPLRDGSGQNVPSDSNPATANPVIDRDFLRWFYTPALSNDGQNFATPEEQTQFQSKRLLFCDPDRLLDTNTLRDVALRLEAFTDVFAAESLAGGGNFGSNTEDFAMESSEDGDTLPVEGNVTGYVFYDLVSSIKSIWHRRDKEPTAAMLVQDQTKKLRGLSFLSKDISPRDSGVWQDGSINEPIEVGIALVKKIDLPEILRSDSYFFYSDQGKF